MQVVRFRGDHTSSVRLGPGGGLSGRGKYRRHGAGRAGAARRPAHHRSQSGGRREPQTGAVTPQHRPQTAAGGRTSVVTSSNWSGYAATGWPAFTSVSSSWIAAGRAMQRRQHQYAAFWVGLDGYSSSTVEQTGSEVDCAGRTAEYYAW